MRLNNTIISYKVYSNNLKMSMCKIVFAAIVVLFSSGCKKLVQVPEPVKSITTSETFNTVATATSALLAIYSDMSLGKNTSRFGNSLITIDAGMSADELIQFGNASNPFFTNSLLPDNSTVSNFIWTQAYFEIYMSNAAIEGLQTSTSLSETTKETLTGEAKFLRAFCYFYLVNLFGDVPLITSTSFANNSLAIRTPSQEVYEQIIADLKYAQNVLPSDYSGSNGERIRANRWAAHALLARTYLYIGMYDYAEAQATEVISNPIYSLINNITVTNNGFKKNNAEAILQLQTVNNSIYATMEGNQFNLNSTNPKYYLTNQLLNAFEPGDKRMTAWTNSTKYQNIVYYYPYKYQSRTETSSSNIKEYYTLLRLAEQYLIRAEAKAQQNNLLGAINDLNIIRTRAGLPALSSLLTKPQVLAAITQENRIEFFAEWGHRWLDLKRTNQADAVLGSFKGPDWQTTDQLYPIPLSEIQYNTNLTQNPGYQ